MHFPILLLALFLAPALRAKSLTVDRQNFLFGAANAAFQVEGSPLDSDWLRWTHTPGKIADGTTADRATDFFHRYAEDFKLAHDAGMNAFRISLAWERIEPSPGVWDERALDRYARMIAGMREQGLEPVVTLHHFVLPGWLADRGGLLAPDFVERFAEYASIAVARLSAGKPSPVSYWMTFNEPMVLVTEGYVNGNWPPGLHDGNRAIEAAASLARAHIEAVRRVRALGIAGLKFSIAAHWGVWDAADWNPLSAVEAKTLGWVFNHQFVKALMTGKLFFWTPGARWVRQRIRLPGGKPTLDYLGINQYGRWLVSFTPRFPFVKLIAGPGVKTDVGWEVYPEGLYRAIKDASRYRLPLLISENGLADHDDHLRPDFLVAQFAQLERALREGANVIGYLHWSLTDNFEWALGLTPRFGLVEVDYRTLERRPRPSLEAYRQLIARFRR